MTQKRFKPFFTESRDALGSLQDLFDLVWPISLAMFHMRAQVHGYINAFPDYKEKDIATRFTVGTGIYGFNLKKTFVKTSWESHLEQFAGIILINSFAIYEAWCEALLHELGYSITNPLQDPYLAGLQFPRDPSKKNKIGPQGVITHFTAKSSAPLAAQYRTILRMDKDYNYTNIDNMMACFRYFKELRNTLVHRKGRANAVTESAYKEFKAVATDAALGLPTPEFAAVTSGRKVTLKLRGVVGFTHILRSIIKTIDAELSASAGAEQVFRNRWEAVYPQPLFLQKDKDKTEETIRRILHNAHMDIPPDVYELIPLVNTTSISRKRQKRAMERKLT